MFTITRAIEYALAKKQQRTSRLSVEFLNWASNQAAHDRKDGSFFSDLWKGFTVYGVCPEEDMPYQDEFDRRRTPSDEAREHALQIRENDFRMHWIKRWNPNTGLTDDQLLEIKRTLNQRWPVCGGFRWPKKPVKWTDDVLETPPPGTSRPA